MQQNNGNNMETTNLINGCLTQLFKSCGAGGDGSTLDVTFLNSVMAELLNVVCKSCQTPADFDATDPASFNQIWNAITKYGGTSGVNAWVSGTTDLIVTSGDCAAGCTFYLANTDETPATNQPSATSTHWYGPYCSLSDVMKKLYEIVNCPKVMTIGDTCGTVNKLGVIRDTASGCPVYVELDESAAYIGDIRPDNSLYPVGSTLIPTNPTDTSTFYTYAALDADNNDSTIDTALLENTLQGCGVIPIDCAGEYDIYIGASINFNPTLAGKSSFVMSLNGSFYQSLGRIAEWSPTTSFSGDYREKITVTLPVGNHTICYYWVGANGVAGNAAQVNMVNQLSSGQPRLAVYRAGV